MNKTEILNLLPTNGEIVKESKSYEDSPMMTIAESVIYPEAFREGARWAIEQIKEKLKEVKNEN